MIKVNKPNIILETSIFLFIFFLVISTSFIYGSGQISSDVTTWIKQWLSIEEHNDNFPIMVKIIFNFIATLLGNVWHFNFIQNLILYFGSFFLIKESLLLGGLSKNSSAIISFGFIFLFFLNPVILSHTSKWYIDYLFSGLLVSSMAIYILSLRYECLNRFKLFIFLVSLAISLKYNAIILVLSVICSYLLFLYTTEKYKLVNIIFGSVMIILLILSVYLIPKTFFDENDSGFYMAVPYYETLGIINNNDKNSQKILESLKNKGIDLTSGLEKYNDKNSGIQTLRTNSFMIDVRNNKDEFKEFYVKEIITKYPFELLRIKFKHFNFFLKNENGAAFSNKLYFEYKDETVIEIFGKPREPINRDILRDVNLLVESSRNNKLINFLFIDLRGSIIILIISLILLNLSSVNKKVKRAISSTSTFSFALIFGFFLANLGAFEKYGFPILLINCCLIYIIFWLLIINLINIYRNKKSKYKIIV